MTVADRTDRAYAEAAALACGPSDADCPAETDDRMPCTPEDARWAALTCPLDGGWVEGEPTPFDIELWTVDALTHFNEALDPAGTGRDFEDGAEQARWDDLTARGVRPW